MIACIVARDPTMTDLLAQVLEIAGFTPVRVRLPEEACECRLVVSFGNLSLRGDRELLTQVRTAFPNSPVLFLGTGGDKGAIEAYRLGADLHMPAPFDLDELLRALSRFKKPGRAGQCRRRREPREPGEPAARHERPERSDP